MAEEDQDQKTESPTGKRLSEARDRGQLPVSREAASWVLFLGVLLVVTQLGPPAMRDVMQSIRIYIEMPHAFTLNDKGLQSILYDILWKVGMATVFVFTTLAFAAILGTMIQTGFFASLELIKPDLERIMPGQGLKKIFSTTSLVEFAKSFGKLIVLGGAAFYTMWPITGDIASLSNKPMMLALEYLHHQTIRIITILLLIFTLIAIADLFFQRWHFTRSLRMTKTEVKDEFKQQEGDPLIKGRLRQIRLEKARKRMMAQVPKADVIITNPTHYAVAMQYNSQKMAAPVVVAKGINLIAERIKEIATEHKIPMVSNPPLARALHETVEVDQEIPTEHYRAVAQIISYVYKLKKQKF